MMTLALARPSPATERPCRPAPVGLPESAAADRRLHFRHEVRRPAVVRSRGDDGSAGWQAGLILDVSRGGLALLLRRPLRPGTHLAVEPLARRGQPPLHMRVVRCTPQEGRWLVGCQLSRVLAEDSLLDLLSGGSHLGETRRAERWPSGRRCRAWPPGSTAILGWSGVVKDISRTGLSVVLPRRLPAGHQLLVAPSPSGGSSLPPAGVVRTEWHGGGWLHGIEFVRELSDSEVEPWLAGEAA